MSGVNITLQVSSQMFSVNVQQALSVDGAQLGDVVRDTAAGLVDRVVAAIAEAVPPLDANDANMLQHTHVQS